MPQGDRKQTMDETTAVAPETADYLGLAREAYDTSTTYFDSSIRKQVEAAIRQFQGVHPAASKYHSDSYKTRSRLFRPKTRAAIRKNEAVAAEALFSTRDVVAIGAEDDGNPMQLAAAEVMKHLMEYRLKKTIPWFLVSMGAYQDALTTGVCISYQYWRYDQNKGIDGPCIELLPIENFRFDPGASWLDPIGSSPYLVRLIPMYVKDVRARMRRAAGGKPRWHSMSDAQLLTAVSAYSDTTRQTRERGRTDSQAQNQAVRDFSIVWVHENIIEIDGRDVVFFTLGTVGLLSDPVPIQEAYWHGKRPFTMGFAMIETHKSYPDGVPGITKDTQAEINDVANMRIDNWKYAMGKRYFVKRSSQVDLRSLTRNVPSSVTLLNDPEKDVKVIDTQDVTSNAFQEQDRLNTDFDDIAGSFSPSSIASNRKLNETVGGLNLLSTNSNQVGSYQLRTWVETWAQPALRQVLLLEAYYEDSQVLLQMAGHRAQEAGFSIEAITDELMQQELSLTVDVGIGATNPQDKVNNFMSAMKNLKELLADGVLERYGLDIEDVVKEIFGHLGYRDGARFFDKSDDPTVQGLQSTIAELKSALAAKVEPMLLAAQIRKLDADTSAAEAKTRDTHAAAVEKTMRMFFASGQAAQMLAAVPQLAPLMDALAKASGYVEPVPAGVDPNVPILPAPAPGITQNSVKDPRTGTEFTPGAAGDTSPLTPASPDSPFIDANQGIDTMRSDS